MIFDTLRIVRVTNEHLSAFMGLLATALMFPIPGLIASMIQRTQVAKMKKVRVRSIRRIQTCNHL